MDKHIINLLHNKKAKLIFTLFIFALSIWLNLWDTFIVAQKQNPQNKKSSFFVIGYSTNIFRNVNYTDIKVATTLLVHEMIKQTTKNYSSTTVVLEELLQHPESIASNDLDIINLTTYEYLEIKNKVKLYPYAVPVINDSCLVRYVVLVRKDGRLNSVKDFAGKKLQIETSSDNYPYISNIWFKLLLKENKLNFEKIFTISEKANQSPSLAVNSVFFKKADVAVISEDEFNTVAELNPQLKRELKILSTSNLFLSTIVCYTEKLKNSPDLELAKSMMYKVNNTQTGRNLLKMYKMKKIVPFKEEYIKNVSGLFSQYSALNKK